jgi:hypothetical protein
MIIVQLSPHITPSASAGRWLAARLQAQKRAGIPNHAYGNGWAADVELSIMAIGDQQYYEQRAKRLWAMHTRCRHRPGVRPQRLAAIRYLALLDEWRAAREQARFEDGAGIARVRRARRDDLVVTSESVTWVRQLVKCTNSAVADWIAWRRFLAKVLGGHRVG